MTSAWRLAVLLEGQREALASVCVFVFCVSRDSVLPICALCTLPWPWFVGRGSKRSGETSVEEREKHRRWSRSLDEKGKVESPSRGNKGIGGQLLVL